MKEQLEGTNGRHALIDALMQQRLVLGDLSLATRLAELGELRTLQRGEALMEQGGVDNAVYFIIEGRVSMTAHGREVAARGANEHFGEMAAVLPSRPRAATGTAVEPSVVLAVPANRFAELADTFPHIWRHVVRHLADRHIQRKAPVRPTRHASNVVIICPIEALPTARAVETHFEQDEFFVKVWTGGVFPGSSYTLENLEAQLNESDFAIAIAQPNEEVQADGNSLSPRDDVLFELGMCVGRLGRARSVMLKPDSEELQLPAGLRGVSTIGYRAGAPAELAALLGPACSQLRERFNELGPR